MVVVDGGDDDDFLFCCVSGKRAKKQCVYIREPIVHTST